MPNFAFASYEGGSGINPNWIFKDNDFAYEMCANKNLTKEM